MLHHFLQENRAELLARIATRAAARTGRSDAGFDSGVSLFLDQLIASLLGQRGPLAAQDGPTLLQLGLGAEQIPHLYGDICAAVLELALDRSAAIPSEEYRALTQHLDQAIAAAVTESSRRRELAIAAQETERLGFLAHETRNLVSAARLAFELLKSGQVAINGSTGEVLERALQGLRELADRTLAEVRIAAHVKTPQRISLAAFLREIEATASVEAKARELRLSVPRLERDIVVMADWQLLASATSNLLQNAFKFTRARGHICLGARTDAGRALLEVEDECGGLPPGRPEALFRSFERRGPERSGIGLGLSISRQAVEASGGQLHVRDLPGKGCVFTIDLPELRTELRTELRSSKLPA
jgi:signal transduction histidine kinase